MNDDNDFLYFVKLNPLLRKKYTRIAASVAAVVVEKTPAPIPRTKLPISMEPASLDIHPMGCAGDVKAFSVTLLTPKGAAGGWYPPCPFGIAGFAVPSARGGITTIGPAGAVFVCSKSSSLAFKLRNCTTICRRSRADDAGISSKLSLLCVSSSEVLPLSDSTRGRVLTSDIVSSASLMMGAAATFRGTGSVSTGFHDPTTGGSQSSPCSKARLPCTCNLDTDKLAQ